jgi:hypothetical protein
MDMEETVLVKAHPVDTNLAVAARVLRIGVDMIDNEKLFSIGRSDHRIVARTGNLRNVGKQDGIVSGFEEGSHRVMRYRIPHPIIAAGIEVRGVHQIIFAIVFQHKGTLVPKPLGPGTKLPSLFGLRDEKRFIFEGNEIVVQFGNIKMAFMPAIEDIFTAIPGVVKIAAPIVVEEHMPINRGVSEIEHRAVEHIPKGTLRRISRGDTDAQALILTPAGTIVHDISSIGKHDFRSPKIRLTP